MTTTDNVPHVDSSRFTVHFRVSRVERSLTGFMWNPFIRATIIPDIAMHRRCWFPTILTGVVQQRSLRRAWARMRCSAEQRAECLCTISDSETFGGRGDMTRAQEKVHKLRSRNVQKRC